MDLLFAVDDWLTSWSVLGLGFLAVWLLIVLATVFLVRGGTFDPNDPRTKHTPPKS
jgi:hypothetical protein